MDGAMSKPIAVLISDIHYNLNTLSLADAAMRQAIAKSNKLQIPLVVAGDLHDSKANLRAECINTMIETFKLCKQRCYVMIGNHDKINEKSETHALNFLGPEATNAANNPQYEKVVLVNKRFYIPGLATLIPYQHDLNELRSQLKTALTDDTIIMHQGLAGTDSGEYIQDKTAITLNDVAGLRIISGHYHARQTIDLTRGGKWDYIGNPYTLNFAESNDPEKGFQILYNDGSLEFVPTNLRKHIVLNCQIGYSREGGAVLIPDESIAFNDKNILWVKMTGTKEELADWPKERISRVIMHKNFKLDLIPTDEVCQPKPAHNLTLPQQLDEIIDKLQVATDRKQKLKELWKEL